MPDTSAPWSAQDALVAVMFAVSASDAKFRTAELLRIEALVNNLPVFADFDNDRIRKVTDRVMALFAADDGVADLFAEVRAVLPQPLWETAYALACEVAASDGQLGQGELHLLEATRDELRIDRLHAAAIEYGVRVRQRLP